MTAPAADITTVLAELAQARRENVDLRAERDQWRTRALHDPLTGLLNRAGLTETWRTDVDRRHGIALIDLDRFKDINDTYGHDAGDHILVQVARALDRRWQIAARLGGDELVVVGQRGDVAELVARWEVRLPGGAPLTVTGTVGVAGCGPLKMALSRADMALLRAKRTWRGSTARWNPAIDGNPVLDHRPPVRLRDTRSAA